MTNGTDDGRFVVNRFVLWVPKLTPKDSLYDKFVSAHWVLTTLNLDWKF